MTSNGMPAASSRSAPSRSAPCRSALRRALLPLAFALALGLAGAPPARAGLFHSPLDALVNEFVYGSLVLSPVTATGVGYHSDVGGTRLDMLLDDYSEAGLRRRQEFYASFAQRIARMDPARLDREQRADLEIIRGQVDLQQLDFTRLQSWRHNPTLYVELIGNALYTPYVLEYAPPAERFRHIIARLRQVPVLIGQARGNLVDSPEVWNRVAREENEGNIALIDVTLRTAAPAALRADYAAAAERALAALREFNDWLAGPLAAHTADWRLDPADYERECRDVLASGRSTDELLAAAEADLVATRAELVRLAAPQGVEEALAAVATAHATPDTWLEEARGTLAQATAFVQARRLVTLPRSHNLRVIETPEFMRGAYAVGGFNPPPPMEPKLGAFYWVTPIPADWPQQRIDSKLREYNRSAFQHLTIHEAMPGHYLQFEYANRVRPLSRRLLRTLYGNGAYVEGWAVYAQQMMTDEGYLDGDRGLRLSLLKQQLRVIANTIIDIRLHTRGMSDEEAVTLMMRDTWQEREEATAKLQRAQLSSCQLAMYYAGSKGWLDVRERYRARHPHDFSLRAFHEHALREGAVPLTLLDGVLR